MTAENDDKSPAEIEARTALREGLERARELVDEARRTLEHADERLPQRSDDEA